MLNHLKYSDLTPAQYEAVGKISVEWSNVEFLMGILLSRLLFTPEFLGRTYSDELTAFKLEVAIRNAIKIHETRYRYRAVSKSTIEEIRELLVRTKTYRETRNKFAHYLWCRDTDDEIVGFKMSGKLPDINKPNKDSMRLSLVQMDDMHKGLHELVDTLSETVSSLPEVDEERHLTKP